MDAAAPASFSVNLEFSPNNGQTWTTVATNLTPNRFGEGQFTWTATEATQGHSGIFRATAVGSGVTAAPAMSSRAISVATPSNTFYINTAGDNNFTDNEYTTAAGNDLNSGTSPASPLASLGVLLRNYDLGPGDTVFVDSGTYNLQENLVIGAIAVGRPHPGTGRGQSRSDSEPGQHGDRKLCHPSAGCHECDARFIGTDRSERGPPRRRCQP